MVVWRDGVVKKRNNPTMPDMFRVSVHVQPGARHSAIVGWAEDVLRVRVAAPPVGGKANEALIVLLADTLGVPKSSVRIQRGSGGRRKLVEVEGLATHEGHRLLGKP